MFNLISVNIRIKEYFYSPILLEKIKSVSYTHLVVNYNRGGV